MKIKKVFYLGNPYLDFDSLGIEVALELKKKLNHLDFINISSTFDLMTEEVDNSIIIDVSPCLKKVTILDPNQICPGGKFSGHDFDLGFLFTTQSLNVKIIGIPSYYPKNKAVEEVSSILEKFCF